jgi:predicted GNAT family N-acyltransferase
MNVKIFDNIVDEARQIRETVFIKEQGFEKEYDELDSVAKHIVIYDGNIAVGTCRVFWCDEENSYHVGRIAVLKEHRKKGLGALLMEEAEKLTRELGGKTLKLGGQLRAAGFYERMGYTAYGEQYLDEGYPHIPFVKHL